ncbi:protein SLC31A2-like [Lineus longissimus]|uniref:protein SLC31A2-like n=1 Tax=Lineus longissimus TaxID=88925 RepID=UPI002B4D412C
MMRMSFEFVDTFKDFIFRGWNASTLGVFIGSCIGICFLAILLDAITVFKEYLHKQANLNPLTYAKTDSNIYGRSPLLAPLIIPPSLRHIKRRKFYYHCTASLVYMIRVILAYVVMLAVMTYNAWVGIAVVLGSAVGYFIFYGLKLQYIDQLGADEDKDSALSQTIEGSEIQCQMSSASAPTLEI